MSAFTALNGGSPKTSEPPSVIADKTTAAEERPSSPSATQPPSRSQQPQAQPQPQPSQPASDTAAATSSAQHQQRDSWSAHAADRSAYQSPSYPDAEAPHKRKRSNSIESRRGHPFMQERTPDTATVPSHPDSRDPYGTPQREHRHFGDDQRDKESWYSHQGRGDRSPYDTQQNSATSTQGHTDEQIGDALRRAASQGDHGDYPNTSPDGDDRSLPLYGGSYGSDHRQDSILQHDPKKRKRNFSNRTKTGCLTCRKRKKKCDEQKPECKQTPPFFLGPPSLFYSVSRILLSLFSSLLFFNIYLLYFSTFFLIYLFIFFLFSFCLTSHHHPCQR
jgi:hypothetical protein